MFTWPAGQGEGTIYENFVSAVALWNFYVLPALVAVVLAESFRRGRGLAHGGRLVVARRLGLIHLGLAVWSLTRVAEDVWASRVMGISPSNPLTGLPGSIVAVVFDVPVGLGLWRAWWWARGAGMTLSGFRTVLAVAVTAWSIQYGAAYDASEWPQTALKCVLPPFVLVTLALPGTKRAFYERHAGSPDPPSAAPARDAALALATLGFLVVLGSVVVTDAADFALRVAAGADAR